jgi:SurA N-terminal domain
MQWVDYKCVPARGRACLAFLVVVAAVLPAGCGGGSSTSNSTTTAPASSGSTGAVTVPSSPASSPTTTSEQTSATKTGAVAVVAGTPIAKASYEHWLAVERALGGASNPSHQALAFLITSDWVLGEAAARKIVVSEAEVKQRFAQIKRQSFPKPGAFAKLLAKSGETEADLLARVKVELLESRIATQVAAGKSGARRSALIASFEKAFHGHWKRYTTCHAGYLMEDCSSYTGKPEDLTATSSTSR